ncbi:MAG TPA: arylesterase [Gemmatimonadales bacterium]|jgi:acyl-CoA thioesterase-1
MRPVVLFVGTSLTAGLGVDQESAYPAVIQRRVDSLGLRWHVVNAGVSGETSAGALRRIAWLLRDSVGVFVLETGANDGLRGLDVDSTRANIEAIIHQVRARYPATPIILVGMEAPPNMGAVFTTRFHSLFPEVARRDTLALVPFLLTGVAGIDTLNQADGIHPTPRGHRIVAENVWRVLGPVLDERRAGAQPRSRADTRTPTAVKR